MNRSKGRPARQAAVPFPRGPARWLAGLGSLVFGLSAAFAAGPPGTGAGLGLLEAVAMTLERDPNIALVESGVAASRGALLSARGAFDPVLGGSLFQDRVPAAPGSASSAEERVLAGAVDLEQRLRSGLVLEPAITLERSAGLGPTANRATVSFAFRQPLLRGRGRRVVAAGERAAERELAASGADLEHTIALRLRAVALQYWRVRAAMYDLEISRATEERSRQLLETTRKLIEADVTPAAEIVQLEADLAAKEATRIADEGALYAARLELGREIGLEPVGAAALPLPSDPFPELAAGSLGREETVLIAEALARRADLRAERQRLEAAEVRLESARDALEPRLDLLFVPSYSGAVEGAGGADFFSPLIDNVPGLGTSLGLSLSWPTLNRRAEGERIQAEAARRAGALLVELLRKSIGADVAIALDALERSSLRAERAARAVEFFERAVENEEKKLRAGSSTLIDLITQRDRLTASRQQEVAARLALAVALVELRFQTGTLTERSGEAEAVRYEDLTTLPF